MGARQSADLAAYPDLVVIYLGFRSQGWRGLEKLLNIGKGLRALERNPPDGLLRHEAVIWGWNHLGMRQYWRDLDSMLAYTRAPQHAAWWRDFGKGGGKAGKGSGFWHETYCRRGGMEAVYLNMPPIGLAAFAGAEPAAPGARERIERDRAA